MPAVRTLLLLSTSVLFAAGCSNRPTVERASIADQMSLSECRIGKDDELDISVYGDGDLAKIQTVRPDGKITFPLIGDIQASDAIAEKLRKQVTQGLSRYLKNPQVTVIVSKFNRKQVLLLGQGKTLGVLLLSSDINLLQGVARADGVTEEAALQGALLTRDARVVPVNFDKLLISGGFNQNVSFRPTDAILIPNVSAKRIFVLGEVKQSRAIALRKRS